MKAASLHRGAAFLFSANHAVDDPNDNQGEDDNDRDEPPGERNLCFQPHDQRLADMLLEKKFPLHRPPVFADVMCVCFFDGEGEVINVAETGLPEGIGEFVNRFW